MTVAVTPFSSAPVKKMTKEEYILGLKEARRMVNTSIGYYFGDEVIPYAEAFKELARRSLEQAIQEASIDL